MNADLLGWVLVLPLAVLIYVPLLRLTARWMALKRLSFGAALILSGMMAGVALLADLLTWPFASASREQMLTIISALLAFAGESALFGYLVTTPEGRSIGLLKGAGFALLSQALLLAIGGVLFIAGVLVLALLTIDA